jgi:hypothetical protein
MVRWNLVVRLLVVLAAIASFAVGAGAGMRWT